MLGTDLSSFRGVDSGSVEGAHLCVKIVLIDPSAPTHRAL